MKLQIKKITPEVQTPRRGTSGAYCLDVQALSVEEPGGKHPNTYLVHTGLKIEIKRNIFERIADAFLGRVWCLKAYSRSSVCNTAQLLSNCVGIIDRDYRGEITAQFYKFPFPKSEPYKEGERCIQIVIECGFLPEIEEVEELTKTIRGEGGYGSTGK